MVLIEALETTLLTKSFKCGKGRFNPCSLPSSSFRSVEMGDSHFYPLSLLPPEGKWVKARLWPGGEGGGGGGEQRLEEDLSDESRRGQLRRV